MRDRIGPEMFFPAGAIDGRLRLHGLPSSGPWDPSRLTFRTAQELEALFAHKGRGWVVLTIDELDHVLDVSRGVPTPINLQMSNTLLTCAQQRWEGTAPSSP